MYQDQIVEEIHEIRRKHAAAFHNDLRAICGALRQEQAKSGNVIVSLKPRRPKSGRHLLAVAEDTQEYGAEG